MKHSTTIISILFLFITTSYSQSWQWAEHFNGSDNTICNSLSSDNNRHIYQGGYFRGEMAIGDTIINAIGSDAFISCFDANGELIWIHTFNGEGSQIVTSIAYHKGFIYLVGNASGASAILRDSLPPNGVFLAKYDSLGREIFIRYYNTSNDGGGVDLFQDIAINDKDEIYITGTMNSDSAFYANDTLLRHGFSDALLVKCEVNGDALWAKNSKGSEYEYGSAVCADDQGVYQAGRYSSTIVFADTSITPVDGADIFIAHYNSNGDPIWIRSAGGELNEEINDIVIDKTHKIWITGWYMGTITFDEYNAGSWGASDIFIARYDRDGIIETWTHTGSAYSDEGNSLIVLNDNSIGLAGTFMSQIQLSYTSLQSDGYEDGFFTRISQDFNLTDAAQIGGSGSMRINDITALDNNNIIINGYYFDEIKFGNITFDTDNPYDGFLARYDFTTGIISQEATPSQYITLYPNPLSDILNIESKNDIPCDVLIYNITGNLEKEIPINKNPQSINLNFLNSGFYTAEILFNHHKRVFKKFIKK